VNPDLVSDNTAGQNNSNLTSLTTSVVNDEWELIFKNSSHYCFYTLALHCVCFHYTPPGGFRDRLYNSYQLIEYLYY
jgi:hypothetical protein